MPFYPWFGSKKLVPISGHVKALILKLNFKSLFLDSYLFSFSFNTVSKSFTQVLLKIKYTEGNRIIYYISYRFFIISNEVGTKINLSMGYILHLTSYIKWDECKLNLPLCRNWKTCDNI